MYKFEFTLKQHTPLIHFQHEQDGATLRATEVKPKLDRYLIDKLELCSIEDKGKSPSSKKEFSSWFQEGRNSSLKYKLQIKAGLTEIFHIINNPIDGKRKDKFPAFFALLGQVAEEEPDKKFCFCQNISLSFFAYDSALAKAIEENIAEFFYTTNFGTRATKGFGSFSVQNKSITHKLPKFTVDTRKLEVRLSSSADQYSERYIKMYKLFYAINLFYSTIRSGINQYDKGNKSIYVKSLLFHYAREKYNANWDKRAIKKAFYSRDVEEQKRAHSNDEIFTYEGNTSFLMRDLLGLASDSAWWALYNDTITKEFVKEEKDQKKNNLDIDRIPSPVVFKPVEKAEGIFDVYIVLNTNIQPLVLDKKFRIKSKKFSKDFVLSTPPKFDLQEYMKFVFNFDITKNIRFKYAASESEDARLLKTIFSDLKKQG